MLINFFFFFFNECKSVKPVFTSFSFFSASVFEAKTTDLALKKKKHDSRYILTVTDCQLQSDVEGRFVSPALALISTSRLQIQTFHAAWQIGLSSHSQPTSHIGVHPRPHDTQTACIKSACGVNKAVQRLEWNVSRLLKACR